MGELRGSAAERAVVDDLVGDRVAAIDVELSDKELVGTLVRQVNRLTTDGAARLVVAAGNGVDGAERRIRRILFTTDRVRSRRIWSSVLNSFLHPTVERFLYNAEDRLRSRRVKNPLLIYRNDGASSRVAKSVASGRGRERKMLSAVLGMLAMLPVVFGVAGWAMVSR